MNVNNIDFDLHLWLRPNAVSSPQSLAVGLFASQFAASSNAREFNLANAYQRLTIVGQLHSAWQLLSKVHRSFACKPRMRPMHVSVTDCLISAKSAVSWRIAVVTSHWLVERVLSTKSPRCHLAHWLPLYTASLSTRASWASHWWMDDIWIDAPLMMLAVRMHFRCTLRPLLQYNQLPTLMVLNI